MNKCDKNCSANKINIKHVNRQKPWLTNGLKMLVTRKTIYIEDFSKIDLMKQNNSTKTITIN